MLGLFVPTADVPKSHSKKTISKVQLYLLSLSLGGGWP